MLLMMEDLCTQKYIISIIIMFYVMFMPRCQDYILIDRGILEPHEICGNFSSNSYLPQFSHSNSMKILFRSSEEQRYTGFFMWVVCLPARCAAYGIGSAFWGQLTYYSVFCILYIMQISKKHQIYSVTSVSVFHIQKNS